MINFVYTSAHMNVLKKYGTMKLLFLLLGCLIILFQSIAWLIVWARDMAVSNSDMIFVGITLLMSFGFMTSQLYFAVRNKKIINIIKNQGKFETKRLKVKFSDRATWAGAFVILVRVLLVLFVILLGVLLVVFIQNYLNWGKILLKMPLMVYFAIAFLDISAELRYQEMIEKVNE